LSDTVYQEPEADNDFEGYFFEATRLAEKAIYDFVLHGKEWPGMERLVEDEEEDE
jgi:hypothetical protein